TLQMNDTNAISQQPLSITGGTAMTGVDSGGSFTVQTGVDGGAIQPGRATMGSGVSNYFGDLGLSTNLFTVLPASNLLAGSTADLRFGNLSLPDGDALINVQNGGGVSSRVTVNGSTLAYSGGVIGSGLIKEGDGLLILAGDGDYTRPTVVSNGTLR